MSVEAQIRDLEQIRDGAARDLEKEKAEVSAEKAKLSAKRTQRLALAAEEAQMSAAVAARHAAETSQASSRDGLRAEIAMLATVKQELLAETAQLEQEGRTLQRTLAAAQQVGAEANARAAQEAKRHQQSAAVAQLRIRVSSITGATELEVTAQQTAAQLRRLIQTKLGTAPDEQKLRLEGGVPKPLDNDEGRLSVPLGACGVKEGSVIHLTPQDGAKAAERRKRRAELYARRGAL